MAETSKDRVIRYLQDLHATEAAGLQSLKTLADEATSSSLKSAVTSHISESQSQADRLEARITALGGTTNAGKTAVNSIVAFGSHILNIFHDKEDKETQDTIKALALEAFEVGAYTSLHAFASAVGDSETASLASDIISEEKSSHDKLLAVIPDLAKNAAAKASA